MDNKKILTKILIIFLERDRHVPSLVHYLDACNLWDPLWPQSEVQSCLSLSHDEFQKPRCLTITCYLLGHGP